jgi:hypothetical protein
MQPDVAHARNTATIGARRRHSSDFIRKSYELTLQSDRAFARSPSDAPVTSLRHATM